MYKVRDIMNQIERLAPRELAEKWDNVGLMVGDSDQNVSTVFICLDVTAENVAAAIEYKANMIISHHPLIFTPLKRVVEDDITGSIIRTVITNGLSVYSAHTNLDHADGGMNDVLAEKLGLEGVRRFTAEECCDNFGNPIDNIGRIGVLESSVELGDFVHFIKETLDCRSIRYVGEPNETIRTVALCTGAGGDGIYSAYHAGADVYITADIRHHEAQLAYELGLNLIDAGHFETENTICEFMADYLTAAMPGLNVISSEAQPYFR